MENAHSPAIRNWLSVDDAFLTCQERGLVRTKKRSANGVAKSMLIAKSK